MHNSYTFHFTKHAMDRWHERKFIGDPKSRIQKATITSTKRHKEILLDWIKQRHAQNARTDVNELNFKGVIPLLHEDALFLCKRTEDKEVLVVVTILYVIGQHRSVSTARTSKNKRRQLYTDNPREYYKQKKRIRLEQKSRRTIENHYE